VPNIYLISTLVGGALVGATGLDLCNSFKMYYSKLLFFDPKHKFY